MKSFESKIVYVKQVSVSQLPAKLRAQAEGREVLFALHNADGAPLALCEERDMAFALAQDNDLAAVSLH